MLKWVDRILWDWRTKKRRRSRILNQKLQALGRMKSGKMNNAELAYSKTLALRKMAGKILWYSFEGITLRLADRTTYTPDFVVMLANGELELHEVKGFWTDDAKVKVKVAAEKFPFRFIAVRMVKGVPEQLGEW